MNDEHSHLLSAYSYELPKEQIATHPLDERSASRLLVVSDEGSVEHSEFSSLESRFKKGDVLVLNDTRVVPARLRGRREPSGGKVEIVLSRREGEHVVALVGMNKKIREGQVFAFEGSSSNDTLRTKVLNAIENEPGAFLLECSEDAYAFAQKHGEIPLPPYMQRDEEASDRERYQTVFAKSAGASAAPTAGLHFDEKMLEGLSALGVEIVYVTLHTGPGTFLPVRTDDVREHKMHVEPWWVSEKSAQALNRALDEKRRIVAVGTTAMRVLESAQNEAGRFVADSSGTTRIFIRPGYRFKCVGALLTNFHLPESTLLMLVSAIAGRERTLEIYREAIDKGYRFFSYGDASFWSIKNEVSQ